MPALNTLLERALADRDLAVLALSRAEELVQRQHAQRTELATYRIEYHQRWAGQFSRQGAIEIVHCYQSFMLRLDEALAQQQRQVDAATGNAQRARQTLLARETRAASIRKLMERRLAEQRLVSDRREQRQTDERAQQASWRAAHAAAASTPL